jgi:hypothetical protein
MRKVGDFSSKFYAHMTFSSQFGRRGRNASTAPKNTSAQGGAPEAGGDDPLPAFDRPFPKYRLTAAMILAIGAPALCLMDNPGIAAPFGRAILVALIAGLPLSLPYALILSGFSGKPLRETGWVTWLVAAGYAMLIAGETMLEINVRCDRAAPQAQVFPVLAKRMTAGDSNNYGVDVEMAAPRNWPETLVGKAPSREYVWLWYDDYYRVVAGSTVIVLDIHPGALGLPWYRRYQYALRRAGPTEAAPQGNRISDLSE